MKVDHPDEKTTLSCKTDLEDEIIGNNLILESVKVRMTEDVKERREQREQRDRDSKLEVRKRKFNGFNLCCDPLTN